MDKPERDPEEVRRLIKEQPECGRCFKSGMIIGIDENGVDWTFSCPFCEVADIMGLTKFVKWPPKNAKSKFVMKKFGTAGRAQKLKKINREADRIIKRQISEIPF